MHAATGPGARSPVVRHAALAVAIGVLIGVTWAAALRAYMITLVGTASVFSWWTIGAVLLPGAIAGGCIGLAHALHARRTRRAWLLGFAPVAFVVLAMLEPGALEALVTTGLGGGAIGVALALVLGGFGLGSVGSRAVRLAGLILALLLTVGVAATVPLIGGTGLALSTPKGAWATALVAGLLLCGILGTAIAFRPAAPTAR